APQCEADQQAIQHSTGLPVCAKNAEAADLDVIGRRREWCVGGQMRKYGPREIGTIAADGAKTTNHSSVNRKDAVDGIVCVELVPFLILFHRQRPAQLAHEERVAQLKQRAGQIGPSRGREKYRLVSWLSHVRAPNRIASAAGR